MAMIGKGPGMVGGFVARKFGGGFKSLGVGLSSGSLSHPDTLRGIGLLTVGLLGTTAMMKALSSPRKRQQRQTPRSMRNF